MAERTVMEVDSRTGTDLPIENTPDTELMETPGQEERKSRWIFALSLSPVQEYVSEARKGRDLRSGSLLLSYLSFAMYAPILKAYGPGAFIVPHMPDNLFFMEWESNGRTLAPDDLKRLSVGARSVTNRAIGWVEENHLDLLNTTVESCANAWKKYANFCKDILLSKVGTGSWEKTWDDQMADFSGAFDVYWVAAPMSKTPDLSASMNEIIHLLERRKDSRLFPQWKGGSAQKCVQCGHREVLAPANARIWSKLKELPEIVLDLDDDRELLCACCLAKRIFGFSRVFGKEAFRSTSEIAAWPYVEMLRGLTDEQEVYVDFWKDELSKAVSDVDPNDWRDLASALVPYEMEMDLRKQVEAINDYWLYDQETGIGLQHRPGPYLAVVMMDGDEMGRTLCKHPDISKVLTEFSTGVPHVLEGKPHFGTVIYSSGDELLALLPKATALNAMRRIHGMFTEEIPVTDCSVGIAFFHCTDSLQYAMNECRNALQQAKDVYGRASLAVSVLIASGAVYRFGCRWKFPEEGDFDALAMTEELIGHLRKGQLSRAFLYDLAEEIPSWVDADPSVLLADMGTRSPMLAEECIAPRLRYLWQRHFSSDGEYDPTELLDFLKQLATSVPNVQNRAANFLGYLKVVDFLAKEDRP